MIKIIAIGNLKEDFYKKAQDEYIKRLSKYNKVEIIEIKEKINKSNNLVEEEKEIKRYIKKDDYVIVLDVNSNEYNSKELTNILRNVFDYNTNICFIIGSSYGLSCGIKELAKLKISFSKLTFPHTLFRIMLLEQIYRSYKIINNETYDK